MSYLLLVVKSHLFLALVHSLSVGVKRETRWRQSPAVGTREQWALGRERGVVAAVNRGFRAWHSGERQNSGILSVAVGGQSIRSETAR